MLKLGWVKRPIAIHNHTKILASRCDGDNSSACIPSNLALCRTVRINLNMKSYNLVIKVGKVWIP